MFKENIDIIYSKKTEEYQNSINLMEKRVLDIFNNEKKELIWFLNYNHIYTIGTSGKKPTKSSIKNVPILMTNRGGKITYHGPGQRIIYFIINLENRKKDIRKFVTLIENAAIKVLRDYEIEATTFSDRVGIWVTKNKNIKLDKEKKLGAIGLRIKKWITYHGLSFNINPELKYYDEINACGLKDYSSTSMKDLEIELSQNDFDNLYLKYFLEDLRKL